MSLFSLISFTVEQCYREKKPLLLSGKVTCTYRQESWTYLPNYRVFEAQLGSGLLDLLLKPRLRTHQVLDKLGHPPYGRVAVQTLQAWGQVLGDRKGQVWRARVETVHYGQLHNLDVLIMGLTYMDQSRGGSFKTSRALSQFLKGKKPSSMLPEYQLKTKRYSLYTGRKKKSIKWILEFFPHYSNSYRRVLPPIILIRG